MSHRIINQYANIQSKGDEELNQELILYKNLATIRDTKSVDIFVQINSTSTTVSPLAYFTNAGQAYYENTGTLDAPNLLPLPVGPTEVPAYYMPIGTSRTINIWEQVNSLMDVRVPRDKYVYEVNLSEAQIVQDPSGWTKQRATTVVPHPTIPNAKVIERTYNVDYDFTTDPLVSGIEQKISFAYFKEALRITQPEPLFVRLPQLTNKPYNWSVTSNGQTNTDKSHRPEYVRDSMVFQNLELEFGHLIFEGIDDQYQKYLDKLNSGNNLEFVRDTQPDPDNATSTGTIKNDIANYQQYQYLDYNWEYQNNDTVNDLTELLNTGNKYVQPGAIGGAVRKSKIRFDANAGVGDVLINTRPFKSNQQAKAILLRFTINVIHEW